MSRYKILEHLSDNENLEMPPAEFYIMYLYFITLKPKTEEDYFLILEYPSYSTLRNESFYNDCIWSTPYMAYSFKPELSWVQNVGRIKNLFQNELNNKAELLEVLSRHRLYHLGLQDYELVKGEHYIEYKESERHRGVWKCYYIQEVFIEKIDPVGLLNLTDPEGLHGYRYFPIKDIEYKNGEIVRFDGKHLATNVANILREQKLQQLTNKAIEIEANSLRYKHEGILIKLDISGFTKIHNKIRKDSWSLNQSGNEIADEFIIFLSVIFEKNLRKKNFTQYRIEGDGFIATVPCEKDNKNLIKHIFEIIENIYTSVNSLLSNGKIKLDFSVRCSIMWGKYHFGKVSSLFSLQQNHAGESLIRLTRMDEYIKEYILKQYSEKQCMFVCVGEEIYSLNAEYLESIGLRHVFQEDKFRETDISAILLQKHLSD